MPYERHPTGYVVPFAAFTAFTPVTPEIFWNVYSAEQRYKYLCDWLAALTEYADTISTEVNDLAEKLDKYTAAYDVEMPALTARVEDLEKTISTIVTSMLVYDPTKGKYTASIDQSRRMLQILANPADEYLTVQTIAESGVTVGQLAESGVMCGEMINQAFKRMAGKKMPDQEVG